MELVDIILGLLLFLVGFIGLYIDRQFFERAVKVPGKVVDYEESQENGKTMYRAIVSYEFQGETRTVTSAVCTSWEPQIGKTCQVGIDPTNWRRARIYHKIPVLWWLFMGVGLALIVMKFFR